MAIYTQKTELPKRLVDLFAPDEELIVATHFTHRVLPNFFSKYGPYYVVTDLRFIEFQRVVNKRTEANEIYLADVTRIEKDYDHIKNQTELTLVGSGFEEDFKNVNTVIDPIIDAVRQQLAARQTR